MKTENWLILVSAQKATHFKRPAKNYKTTKCVQTFFYTTNISPKVLMVLLLLWLKGEKPEGGHQSPGGSIQAKGQVPNQTRKTQVKRQDIQSWGIIT